jgi:hypothetical protein
VSKPNWTNVRLRELRTPVPFSRQTGRSPHEYEKDGRDAGSAL